MAGSVPDRFNGRFSAGQVQWQFQCRAGSTACSVPGRFNGMFSAGQVQWQVQCRAGSMIGSVPCRFNGRFSGNDKKGLFRSQKSPDFNNNFGCGLCLSIVPFPATMCLYNVCSWGKA